MLKGDKVVLDAIDPNDIEWMRKQRNDQELRKYFREWKDISKDQQNEWYKARGNNSDDSHVYFRIARHSGDLVGCCGLHYVDWRLRSAEFGVFVGLDFRGSGYGSEAIHLMFDYGFREMNLHKIYCEVYDNNKAIGVYKKIGFEEDGISRDSYFSNGKYGNSTMMSILEEEWFENNGGR